MKDCIAEQVKPTMEYVFQSGYYKESNRVFIKIPFNVWDTCGMKGNIPVKAVVDGVTFECKLIPKGGGEYVLPVQKEFYHKLDSSGIYNVKITILKQLSRINNDSPYSKEHPIRCIEGIQYIKQPESGYCGQTCLAMLAGISVAEVIKIMKSKKWQASISKVLETLDYFGFSYKPPIYTHGKKTNLPKCCIVSVRGNDKNHFMVYYDGLFYDPATNVTSDYPYEYIINFIEVYAA